MSETIKLKAECGACKGTGLYSGFAEPIGTSVICIRCDGTGCAEIVYTPFKERKEPKNIPKQIRLSRGSFIFSCGPCGRSITYDQFKKMDAMDKLELEIDV